MAEERSIDKIFRELLGFVADYTSTYVNLLIRPRRIFGISETSESPALDPTIFAIIACFFFSIFVPHFELFSLDYFRDSPFDFLISMKNSIRDFSIGKALLRCIPFFLTIYLLATAASWLVKRNGPDRKFIKDFILYYSGWQILTGVIILVIRSVEFLYIPPSRPSTFIGNMVSGIVEGFTDFFETAAFLLFLFITPIIIMLVLRKKIFPKKLYFRMLLIAVIPFVPMLLNVKLGNLIAEMVVKKARPTGPFYYYKDDSIEATNHGTDSIGLSAKVIVANLNSTPLFVDPQHGGEVTISSIKDISPDSPAFLFLFKSTDFSIKQIHSDTLIRIGGLDQQILSLEATMSRKEFSLYDSLSNAPDWNVHFYIMHKRLRYNSKTEQYEDKSLFIDNLQGGPIRFGSIK